ncbi:MAG: M1 family metallopeptidase, partial [Gemmatimonadota bacterium]
MMASPNFARCIRFVMTACAFTWLTGVLPAVASAQARPHAMPSEPLPLPRTVKHAYVARTRLPDGRPGPNYWQNRARYTMTLSTNPPDRTVTGTEQIVYFNNSPDTLRQLVVRLIVNIHKPGAPRGGGADDAYLTSGVQVDRFTVNGQTRPWNNGVFTVAHVQLPAPLLPHDSVSLGFDWRYDMSRRSGREGAIDSTTFFLAYAYPRVSVYDDYNGWDTTPFNDQLEFYSDFNDYDVTVKVPANFVVWGTGALLNPAEVLQPAQLQRYQASLTSEQTINVATAAEMRAHAVTVQQPVNAWHFRTANVPDVTFALSDHYVWDAGSVAVEPGPRPRVSVQAAYNDTAADFRHMVRYASHALDWLSHEWPGVPYPYEKTTVVEGFAGMEYPMMVNDESYPDTVFSRFVAEHEIAHTYFPFYMGINETRHTFMDEGWATTFEYLIATADLGPEKASEFFRQFRVNGWAHDPGLLDDQPIITPGSTGNNGYGKPALGYLAVKDLLNDALFRKALHAYMDRWHGKHPIPWDFFNSFNDASGRNLNWFWRNWFFTDNYIDLALTRVTRAGKGYRLVIDNVGGMAAPVDVVLQYTDGTSTTVHQTPAIWQANQRRASVTVPTRKAVQSIALSGGIWVDAD